MTQRTRTTLEHSRTTEIRASTYSRSISTRGSFLASRARGTWGTNFTRTSCGTSLTTGTFASFFANRTRRARGSSISLNGHKRDCQSPGFQSIIVTCPAKPTVLTMLAPHPSPNPQILTEGPGGPTRPAAPGKPVAPWPERTQRGQKRTGSLPGLISSNLWLWGDSTETWMVLTGGPAEPRAPLGPGAPTLPCKRV